MPDTNYKFYKEINLDEFDDEELDTTSDEFTPEFPDENSSPDQTDSEFNFGVDPSQDADGESIENAGLESDINSDGEFGSTFFDEFSDDDAELESNETDPDAVEELQTDANFQGSIRTIAGAVLVYKRKTADDSFNELWVFNVNKDLTVETQIRKAILAGTNINAENQRSEDGKQLARTYTVGNIQFLDIIGIDS